MRSPEQQQIAFDCLELANAYDFHPAQVVEAAQKFYAFVSGEEPVT